MGNCVTVHSIAHDQVTGFSIIAEVDPVPCNFGTLKFNAENSGLKSLWNDIFVLDLENGENVKTALQAIDRNLLRSRLGKNEEIRTSGDRIYRQFRIKDYTGTIVTYRFNDGNNVCDAVTVQIMKGGREIFKITLGAENGVNAFTESAMAYLSIQPEADPTSPVAIPNDKKPSRPSKITGDKVALNR
ncbi:MAG: hypothetical protein Q7T03_10940 [Deltaproteobacteria bacterium]|nr:hypothetical protein [Deltaproteobacteria bacterium]